jgi:iron(II)-dependent oxidoreductase
LFSLVVALGGGCLKAPGYDNTMYACVESNACPPGYECRAGVCVEGAPDAATSDDVVAIPAGSFEMGCTIGVDGCPAAWAKHQVTLTAFAIDKYEVTQAEFQDCVASSGCDEPLAAGYDPATSPRSAVRGVSHAMAAHYCSIKGKQLPTEAQWERAARTLDEPFPWGTDAAGCGLANYDQCSIGRPEDVDNHVSKTGLFQVAGNVREWVADFFLDSFYANGQTNPNNQTETGTRVLRGGSYATGEMTLRVWYRDQADKIQQVPDAGFRCAKPL